MREQGVVETEPQLEGAAYAERILQESLHVRLGKETSRMGVLEAAHDELPTVTFVVTDMFDIFLSDKHHDLILTTNELPNSHEHNVAGYTGLRGGEVVIKYYQQRGDYNAVFHVLHDKSGMTDDAFDELCRRMVRRKIEAFLKST